MRRGDDGGGDFDGGGGGDGDGCFGGGGGGDGDGDFSGRGEGGGGGSSGGEGDGGRGADLMRIVGWVEGMAVEVDKGSMTIVGRFDAKKLRDRVASATKTTRVTVAMVGTRISAPTARPVIVTVVLTAGLHCAGYMPRIHCKLFRIKGIRNSSSTCLVLHAC
nr:translation initiation factor IF-2-like [Aegilops tauschii subsp. strangulata]